MADEQRDVGILADAHDDDHQYTDGEAGHDVGVDDRNLIHRAHRGLHALLRVEGADGTEAAEDGRDQRRGEGQGQGTEDHRPKLLGREEGHIVLKGEAADRTDRRGVGEAVDGEDQDRQIQKEQHRHEKYGFPELFHHSTEPPLRWSSSPVPVSRVKRQINASRISAIMEPPCQLYAEK